MSCLAIATLPLPGTLSLKQHPILRRSPRLLRLNQTPACFAAKRVLRVRAKIDGDGKTGNWVDRLPIPGVGAENVFRLISSATGSPIGQFISSPVTFLHSVDPRIKLVWLIPLVLLPAKAIAGGTGYIIRGLFSLSNGYTNKVHKGGDIVIKKTEEKSGASHRNGGYSSGNSTSSEKESGIRRALQRVRKLSAATENLSKTMLNGAEVVSGAVMVPMMMSKPGKAFFSMVPGQVLLASLESRDKILDASEAAERQAMSATSGAATKMVNERFGEKAGEATGDVLATAEHVVGTTRNVFSLPKALNPSAALTTGIVEHAPRN